MEKKDDQRGRDNHLGEGGKTRKSLHRSAEKGKRALDSFGRRRGGQSVTAFRKGKKDCQEAPPLKKEKKGRETKKPEKGTHLSGAG